MIRNMLALALYLVLPVWEHQCIWEQVHHTAMQTCRSCITSAPKPCIFINHFPALAGATRKKLLAYKCKLLHVLWNKIIIKLIYQLFTVPEKVWEWEVVLMGWRGSLLLNHSHIIKIISNQHYQSQLSA